MSAGTATWLPLASLWRREVVRFLREPSRILSAAATPLVFWLLIGSGFSGAFRLPGGGADGVGFLAYFYPGTVVLVVLFAAIFSTISLIEDRRDGFLQGVLAAPVTRLGMVGGKVAGGATLAWVQGAAFLVLADLVARTVLGPGELPVGIVTALVGGPFFLLLLRRGRYLT